MNKFGFCLLAKEQSWNDGFWVAFLRWYGLDRPDVQAALDGQRVLAETEYTRKSQPSIPRKTHRVWVTDPELPTECVGEGIKDPVIFEELLKTNQALEKSGHKWEHYLWTNSKKAIPKTVQWFEEHGHIVRELHELPSYDSVIS